MCLVALGVVCGIVVGILEYQVQSRLEWIRKRLDVGDTDVVNRDSLCTALHEDRQLRKYLRSLRVSTYEALRIFDLLDSNSENEVHLDAFMVACTQCQGPERQTWVQQRRIERRNHNDLVNSHRKSSKGLNRQASEDDMDHHMVLSRSLASGLLYKSKSVFSETGLRIMLQGLTVAVTAAFGGRPNVNLLNSPTSRIVIMCLTTAGMVLLSVYTANLAASFTVTKFNQESNITDIGSMHGRKAAVICNTAVSDWLTTYHPQVKLLCVETYDGLKDAVIRGAADATVYDAPLLEKFASDDCRLQVVGETFSRFEYGLALPKGSSLLEPISAAVTYLRETGAHERLYDLHFSDSDCTEIGEDTVTMEQLKPENLAAFGMVFVGVLGFGLLAFLLVDMFQEQQDLKSVKDKIEVIATESHQLGESSVQRHNPDSSPDSPPDSPGFTSGLPPDPVAREEINPVPHERINPPVSSLDGRGA
jgi:hypothetical protein